MYPSERDFLQVNGLSAASIHGADFPIIKEEFDMPTRILRLPEVKERTGLSRSTIYAYMAKEAFPESISLGPRTVGWIEAEVEEWLQGRIDANRGRSQSPAGNDADRLDDG